MHKRHRHHSGGLHPIGRAAVIFALGAATAVAVETTYLSIKERQRAEEEITRAVSTRFEAIKAMANAERLARQVLQPLAIDVSDRLAVHGVLRKIFGFSYAINILSGLKQTSNHAYEKIFRMYDWMQTNIIYERGNADNEDKMSSLEVIGSGKGNCYEQITLLNAMVKSVFPQLLTRFVVTEENPLGDRHTYLEVSLGKVVDAEKIKAELVKLFQGHYGMSRENALKQVRVGVSTDGEDLYLRLDVSLKRANVDRERLPSMPGDSCVVAEGCKVSRLSYTR